MIDPLLGLRELLLNLRAHNLLDSVFLNHFKSFLIYLVVSLAFKLALFPILLLFRPGIIHDLWVRLRRQGAYLAVAINNFLRILDRRLGLIEKVLCVLALPLLFHGIETILATLLPLPSLDLFFRQYRLLKLGV